MSTHVRFLYLYLTSMISKELTHEILVHYTYPSIKIDMNNNYICIISQLHLPLAQLSILVPSKYIKEGPYWPTREMPFKWRFPGGQMDHCFMGCHAEVKTMFEKKNRFHLRSEFFIS